MTTAEKAGITCDICLACNAAKNRTTIHDALTWVKKNAAANMAARMAARMAVNPEQPQLPPRGLLAIMRHSFHVDDLMGATRPYAAERPFDSPILDFQLPVVVAAELCKVARIRKIRSSPMRRCVQTAALVAFALNVSNLEIDYNLIEMMPQALVIADMADAAAREWAPLSINELQAVADDVTNVAGDVTNVVHVSARADSVLPQRGEDHRVSMIRIHKTILAAREEAAEGGDLLLVTHGDAVNAAVHQLSDNKKISDVMPCGWVLMNSAGLIATKHVAV
jgi:broad specificity phosphatase PhoE